MTVQYPCLCPIMAYSSYQSEPQFVPFSVFALTFEGGQLCTTHVVLRCKCHGRLRHGGLFWHLSVMDQRPKLDYDRQSQLTTFTVASASTWQFDENHQLWRTHTLQKLFGGGVWRRPPLGVYVGCGAPHNYSRNQVHPLNQSEKKNQSLPTKTKLPIAGAVDPSSRCALESGNKLANLT